MNITVPKIKMLLAANKAQRVVNFSSFLLVTVNREKKNINKSVFHKFSMENETSFSEIRRNAR